MIGEFPFKNFLLGELLVDISTIEKTKKQGTSVELEKVLQSLFPNTKIFTFLVDLSYFNTFILLSRTPTDISVSVRIPSGPTTKLPSVHVEGCQSDPGTPYKDVGTESTESYLTKSRNEPQL